MSAAFFAYAHLDPLGYVSVKPALRLLANPPAPPELPDAGQALEWAQQELAKPEYLAAQPNAFERASLAVVQFFDGLFNVDPGDGKGSIFIFVILALLLVAFIVIGVVVWGRPRASRHAKQARVLLGDTDTLTAAELRHAASAAAAAGSWALATVQRFRALAKGLIERELLDPAPGATAQAIAASAATRFPTEREALRVAALHFDEVRYLDQPGTQAHYASLAELDTRLAQAKFAPPAQLVVGA